MTESTPNLRVPPTHSSPTTDADASLSGSTRSAGDRAWSRLLLVEGTAGVGKSTLIDQLIRRYVARQPPRKLRTLLHLTQAHTYGPLAPGEDVGALTVTENLTHLNAVATTLEWHVLSLASEATVKFLAVVDTLHLTQCHRPGVLGWNDVSPIDERLARLDVRLVFLRGSASTIWSRGIVPRRDDEFITGYAHRRFGDSLKTIHEYFVAEQDRMGRLLSKTRLRHIELDADRDLERNLAEAYDFWLA